MSDDPYYVGKRDEHTGVADSQGIPYTYEHVDEPPQVDAKVYQVTAYIDFSERPTHKNVYYVPSEHLDQFIRRHTPELFEEIVDIRPTTYDEAESEMSWYRGEGDE